jgi:hypothetical protein
MRLLYKNLKNGKMYIVIGEITNANKFALKNQKMYIYHRDNDLMNLYAKDVEEFKLKFKKVDIIKMIV